MKILKPILILFIMLALAACTSQSDLQGRWYISAMYDESLTQEEIDEQKANLQMLKILGMDAVADFNEDGSGKMYFYPESEIESYISDFDYNATLGLVKLKRIEEGEETVAYGKITLEDDQMAIRYNGHVIYLQRHPLEIPQGYEEIINQIMTAEILEEVETQNEE